MDSQPHDASAMDSTPTTASITNTTKVALSTKPGITTIPLELRFQIFSALVTTKNRPVLWPGLDLTYETFDLPSSLFDINPRFQEEASTYMASCEFKQVKITFGDGYAEAFVPTVVMAVSLSFAQSNIAAGDEHAEVDLTQ